MSEIQFTDRYQALGIPYPDLSTMCQGQCEGTGWVPVSGPVERKKDSIFGPADTDPVLLDLWWEQHQFTCGWLGRIRNGLRALVTLNRYRWRMAVDPCDGYHFVKCPDCGGAGKRV